MNSNIHILELIGKGRDASVYKCIYNDTECAVKVYRFNDGIPKEFLREVSFFKNVKHKNIVKMIDVHTDKHSIGIVMELMNYELVDAVINNKIDINKATKGLIDCVQNIHESGYVHGDLSIGNIMLKDTELYIIDMARSSKSHRHHIIFNPTIYVSPPELLSGKKILDPEKIDTWALGCVLFFIQTKNVLFQGTTLETQQTEIRKKRKYTEYYTSNNQNIGDMLQFNYRKRIDLKEKKIKITKYDCVTSYTTTDLEKIIMLLLRINEKYRLPIENIFITIHNIFRLKGIKTYNKKNKNKIIVLHKMSIRVSSDFAIRNYHLTPFLNGKNYDIKGVETHILSSLDWNIDPVTIYDYVGNIKDNKQIYEILLLFCSMTSNFCIMNYLDQFNILNDLYDLLFNDKFADKIETNTLNILDSIYKMLISKSYYDSILNSIMTYLQSIGYYYYFCNVIKSIICLANTYIPIQKYIEVEKQVYINT